MTNQVKYVLGESEMPREWYNIIPDLPAPPPPPLHPGTREPVGPDALAPLFPMALIMQEVSGDRHIAIPEPVLDVYRLWRPTPLYRARRLEKDLGTPAKIYYKYEGVSPAGSHKPNTAVPQAYYNAQEGIRKLTTETGAGQWGTALSFACALFGIDLEVWMVRSSYDQKPYRKILMETYGATVHASPSDVTNSGRAILEAHPDSTGSLGIAISEAVEKAGDQRRHQVLARQRAQPRAHAPDGHRRGGDQAARRGRRHARRDRGLHRRRVEFRRPGVPVPAGEAGRPDEPRHPRGRASRLPVIHQGPLRVRLRRHGRPHAIAENAYPRP